MFCRQLSNPCSIGKQHGARQDNNCCHAFSDDRRKRAVEFAANSRFCNLKLHAQRPRGNLRSLQLDRDAWLAGVDKDGDTPDGWGELPEKLQALPAHLRRRHPQRRRHLQARRADRLVHAAGPRAGARPVPVLGGRQS